MIDEAHAFLAFGDVFGRGLYGEYVDDIDIITATFGKALGSFGAFVVTSNDIVEMLMAIEENFGITVSDEEAVTLKTIADVADFIEKKI